MYDAANKSHHDVADIKTFKVFFFVKSSEAITGHICKVKRMYNALQINGKCSGGGKVPESEGNPVVGDQDEWC